MKYRFCNFSEECYIIKNPNEAITLAYYRQPRGMFYFIRFQNTVGIEQGSQIPLTAIYPDGFEEPYDVRTDVGVDCFLIGDRLQEALDAEPYDYPDTYHDRKYAVIFRGLWVGDIEDGYIATMNEIVKVIPMER